jgi:polysaccharide biosynthesis transport protein
MSNAVVIPGRYSQLEDPAESQHPITFYIGVLRRKARSILLIALGLTALAALISAFLPPVHTGVATIAIDRQSAPTTVGEDHMLSIGDDQFMATQQSLLQADIIVRPVADRYNLLEREHQYRESIFWKASPEKIRAIHNAPIVLKHLKVERKPNTYLLTITYRDSNPAIAAAVANAIADSYLGNIFDTRIRETGRLTSSMERQLLDLKQKMESSHQALMAYQRQFGTADPEQKTSVLVARLQALNTENSLAEADRIAKESVFREAKDQTLPEVQVSSQSTELAHDVERLQTAKANLAFVASTFGSQHPEYLKAAAQVEQAKAALDESRQNVASRIAIEYRQALARQRMLSSAVAQTKEQVDDLASQSFDYLQLKHEAETAEQVYKDLFAKIKQAGINSELQNNVIRLADSARPAAKAVFPNWPLLLLIYLSVFLFLCSVYSISLEMMDVTAKDPAAVEKAFGLPVICALPRVSDMQLRLALGPDGLRIAGSRWRGLQGGFFDEGVRHLRSYLMLSIQTKSPKSVLVTSALPGEGKSTLALSLAMVSADQGKRTLLIDGDVRQPASERMVRLEPDAGLADVLGHRTTWRAAARSVPGRPNLSILGTGLPLPMAVNLIGPEIRTILEQAIEEFDFVVIDSPPLLGCAETVEIAAAAEVTLLAVRSGSTALKTVGLAVETLRRVDIPIAGIVLNESTVAIEATNKAFARYYVSVGSA